MTSDSTGSTLRCTEEDEAVTVLDAAGGRLGGPGLTVVVDH